MIPIEIQGQTKGGSALASVHNPKMEEREGEPGLLVYTDEAVEYNLAFGPAINPISGQEMAIDASFGGTPIGVYNGADTVLWTASAIVGTKFDFTDTTQPRTGSADVESDKAAANDVMQFDKGSSQDLSAHVALTIWIYVASGFIAGNSVSVYGYDTGGAVQVGNKVLLEDYFNELDFGVYQNISIPFTDMGLETSTIDSFRMEIESKSGAGIVFYLDDIQIEETGGSTEFKVTAPVDQLFLISSFRLTFIDAYDTTLASNSMAGIDYDQILGLAALTNGISIQSVRKNQVTFSLTIRTIGDIIKAGADLLNPMSQSGNTFISIDIKFPEPVLLDPRSSDMISVVINDDLTGLISFTAIGIGRSRAL